MRDETNDEILAGVAQWARENGVECEAAGESHLVVQLPGERKLKTTVSIRLSTRSADLQAFVIRHPDENREEFTSWLLRRNMKLKGVAFAVDRLGDVYLNASLPRERLLGELDALLGAILTAADESFNELLLIGFITSMKREWAWRISRGESTRNLAAFADVLSGEDNEFLTAVDGQQAEDGEKG
ncbi:putative sensory transduction regulator [Brevibacterium sanguinis]|uniref:Sensory transduction regulator n=2 Tax=Brevibacterium TaxID=1696 RepID=A0ABX9GQI1_9MICO|nr:MULTISPECIES: YbjN domain-containing protein [Brevibacterium]RBP65586.1 putative sensory transduction regulator [Brevibacterium sanguinis]RBP72220.1 putative sensory transduction regulator [Brevibacterium celere]